MKDAVSRWLVNAAFAVHPDQKSHTGYYMTASVQAENKNLIPESSTEAELAATDDDVRPTIKIST